MISIDEDVQYKDNSPTEPFFHILFLPHPPGYLINSSLPLELLNADHKHIHN